MGRSRLYKTEEEKAMANREKSKKHYERSLSDSKYFECRARLMFYVQISRADLINYQRCKVYRKTHIRYLSNVIFMPELPTKQQDYTESQDCEGATLRQHTKSVHRLLTNVLVNLLYGSSVLNRLSSAYRNSTTTRLKWNISKRYVQATSTIMITTFSMTTLSNWGNFRSQSTDVKTTYCNLQALAQN